MGCAHRVIVYSEPPGASIYVEGKSIGPTPASFTERSGYHKKCAIRAELEGYQPWTQEFAQDHPSKILVPSVVGSYYLLFPVVGVLWGYQLPDEVTLFLKPTGAD